MRLRYLHLPKYGVLRDLRVCFDREIILDQPGKLFREGNLHFIVGLNGAGKSSLLRALYETFRWITGVVERSIDPRIPVAFPVTLVYDISDLGESRRTCAFHQESGRITDGFFYQASSVVDDPPNGDWEGWINWLHKQRDPAAKERPLLLLRNDQLQSRSDLHSSLPSPLIAYTSGSMRAWSQVLEPELPEDELPNMGTYPIEKERPRGWTVPLELGLTGGEVDADDRDELSARDRNRPDLRISQCMLLAPEDAKLAAISLGLTTAAFELELLFQEDSTDRWRRELQVANLAATSGNVKKDKSARTLFNYIDWWYPTHLSIEYCESTSHLNPELMILCALSEEVIRQPLRRRKLIIDLGTGTRFVKKDVEEVYDGRKLPAVIDEIIDRVDGARSGAQAVVRTLCSRKPISYEDSEPESVRWDVFQKLYSWKKVGLIDDISVTIKRVSQPPVPPGESSNDNVIVTWEDMSDGEQMLLARMSLLMLLAERDGSLLLLDEPETHFNDSWKRELIDIVDDNILKKTFSHVLVATHTSIALTDAFASEIIRLIRQDGEGVFKPVSFATFGAEPGRIMLNVFDLPEAIGSRAEEVLRVLLEETDWKGRRPFLEHVLTEIGGGWPRARLREILEEL